MVTAMVPTMTNAHGLRSSAVVLAVVVTSLALTALTAIPSFAAGAGCAHTSCEFPGDDVVPHADSNAPPCASSFPCPGTGPAHLVHSGLVGPRTATFRLALPLTAPRVETDPRDMIGTLLPEDLDRPPRQHG